MYAAWRLQNTKNPPEIYVSDGSMAERVGFEPTEGVSPQLISSFPRFLEADRSQRKITENSGSLQRHYNTGKNGIQERKRRENPGGTTAAQRVRSFTPNKLVLGIFLARWREVGEKNDSKFLT